MLPLLLTLQTPDPVQYTIRMEVYRVRPRFELAGGKIEKKGGLWFTVVPAKGVDEMVARQLEERRMSPLMAPKVRILAGLTGKVSQNFGRQTESYELSPAPAEDGTVQLTLTMTLPSEKRVTVVAPMKEDRALVVLAPAEAAAPRRLLVLRVEEVKS